MPKKRRRKKIKVETLLKLGERAGRESEKYHHLFGSPEDASQEYIKRLLEGYHSHATVGQAVVDMSRELMGRKGQPGYEAKKAVALAIQVDPNEIRGTAYRPFDVVNRRLFLEKAIQKLSRQQQGVIMLYLAGYTLEEISIEIGFSEARIHQIWKEAVRNMKLLAKM